MSQQPHGEPHLRGAVDLSSLARPASPSAAQPGGPTAGQPGSTAAGPDAPGTGDDHTAGDGSWVLTGVTDADLQQLVQLSSRVPVLVHLAVPSGEASAGIDQVLNPAVDARGGRLVLARVDVEAHPQALQVFGLPSGPAVIGILAGQPVPLLNQAAPADQVNALLDELLQVAVQNGMSDSVPPLVAGGQGSDAGEAGEVAASGGPALSPLQQRAQDALVAGDYAGAVEAFREALRENPADEEAKVGLASAQLLERTSSMDAAAVRERAAGAPEDVAVQIDVADLDLLGGHVEDAFSRLVRFIAAHPGEDRERARKHLVELYSVVGDQDPRTAASRKALSRALF